MNLGIIGGADGPTAVLVSESIGFEWISVLGIIIVILMLIPNVIYAVKFRGRKNKCTNKVINILEQIGRYACMILMIFSIGMPKFGFPSAGNFIVYIWGNIMVFLIQKQNVLKRLFPVII